MSCLRRHQQGYSLIEVLLALGILPILIVGVLSVIEKYGDSSRQVIQVGEYEDVRRYLRANFDCVNTALHEVATCQGSGGYIRGFDKNNQPMSQAASVGMDFNGVKVRTFCKSDGVSLNIGIQVKPLGESSYRDIKGIPITCKICGVDVATLPATFPPAPIPASPMNLIAYLRNRELRCSSLTVPNHLSLLHTTGALTQRGHYKPFIIGTVDMPTMKKVCEILGYRTYVSSSCVKDDEAAKRCNYTSPGGNQHYRWNGTAWVTIGAPVYYTSWLSSITCTDPL